MNERLRKQVALVLAQLEGLADDARFDAGETAIITKALEYTLSRVFEKKYPAFMARQFIPVNTEVPNGADTYTYHMWDMVGMAKIISDYADDLPSVELFSTAHTGQIQSIGTSFNYSIQDLRRAAQAGVPLQQMKANMTRLVTEAKIDELAAFGDSTVGLTGFLNSGNVPVTSLTTASWASATPQEILADLRELELAIRTATKGIHPADTLILATESFDICSTTELSASNNQTILKQFLETSPGITNIGQWPKMDLADAGRTGPRIMMYKRDPDVVELFIPQEYETLAPQARNLAFVVPCHARHGGVSWRYPLAASYADSI